MSVRGRVGLLGGTFDPVHVGHLHIASCAQHELALDEVVLLPAGSPPHKTDARRTDGADRLRMLEIATASSPLLRADDLDLGADAPSYTSGLLERFREHHPDIDLWFIIGADSLHDFGSWHEPDRILELTRLAVAQRPGWNAEHVLESTPLTKLRERTDLFSNMPVDLSSTAIRHRLETGEPVDWLVPAPVLNYINEHHLYR